MKLFQFFYFFLFQRVSKQRSYSLLLRGWSLLNVVLLVKTKKTFNQDQTSLKIFKLVPALTNHFISIVFKFVHFPGKPNNPKPNEEAAQSVGLTSGRAKPTATSFISVTFLSDKVVHTCAPYWFYLLLIHFYCELWYFRMVVFNFEVRALLKNSA